jgi:hypothetical protein
MVLIPLKVGNTCLQFVLKLAFFQLVDQVKRARTELHGTLRRMCGQAECGQRQHGSYERSGVLH